MAVQLPNPMEHRITPDLPPLTWDVVEPVFDVLEAMPLDSPGDLQAFLAAWNETRCWIWDEVAKSRVEAGSRTDEEEAQKRWKSISSNVLPDCSRRTDALNRKLLDSNLVDTLEDGPYASFLRQVRSQVELFREENVELLAREDELRTRYLELSGGWTFEMDGEQRTLSQMFGLLAASDRAMRERAWRQVAAGIAETADDAEALFEELFALRHQIATNAGFDNYRDYKFAEKLRDYGPDVCHMLAEVIEAEVLPLVQEFATSTTAALGLDCHRPWDRKAQPDGGQPLRPFEDVEELKDGVERMMTRLDPGLGERFAAIRENMDLQSRPCKRQGGFMTWYFWDKRPFVFMNASGRHLDLVTLLHECGHAFHWLLANEAGSRPMDTMTSAKEFSEVASMSMELLHYDTLDEFYDPADHDRAVAEHLRRVPGVLARVAQGDQFQHWLYTNPEHTRAERRAKWQELTERYSPQVDFSGIDSADIQNRYHLTFHFFTIPFYFIEYAFAQLGALQIAVNAEKDRPAAIDAYKSALAIGPQRDVRGLYAAAGAEFLPTAARVREAMSWIRQRLPDTTPDRADAP